MAINLLDMLKDNISGDMISQASKFLGENESGVKSAMSDVMPSVLGSMINFGSTDSGAGKMMNMLKDGNHDGGILDNLGGLFGGGNTTSGLVNTGSSLLKGMMGQSMLGSVIDMVSSRSGISKNSSTSMMGMIAPIAMGMIGRYAKNKALDAVGLGSFLRGQRSGVMGALPSAISNLMGGNEKMNVRETASNTTRGAANTATNTVKNTGRAAANATTEVAEKASGGIGRILKWAVPIVAILGIASWFGFSNVVGDKAKDLTSSAVDVTKNATEGAAGMVKDAGSAVVDAGKGALDATTAAASKALEGVKFATGSIGEGMANFMKDGGKGDKTFQFNNLNFATGSATAPDMSEIDNLAAVLKAYPTLSIEVGGHTDSSGNAEKNTQLSDARAATVKARLVAKGIDGARVSTKGYGSAKPVASNESAEGKAKNRRIEVMITKR